MSKKIRIRYGRAIVALVSCALTMTAWAGRPLSVDDASINEKGHGHIEAWWSDGGAGTRAFNIAPAFAIASNVELAALFARNTDLDLNAGALQAKVVLTQLQERGCNFAVSAGVSRVQGSGGTTPFGTLITTCVTQWFPVHLNVGAVRPNNDSTVATWGIAIEKELIEGVSAHVEGFGARHGKPTFQVGLRSEIVPKTLQLDGTVGRNDGQALFSIGLKWMF